MFKMCMLSEGPRRYQHGGLLLQLYFLKTPSAASRQPGYDTVIRTVNNRM